MENIKNLFFSTKGKINGKEFFLFQFILGLFYVIYFYIFGSTLFGNVLFFVIFFGWYIIITIKRLRDIGVDSKWVILLIVPVVNLLFIFYLLVKEGVDDSAIMKKAEMKNMDLIEQIKSQKWGISKSEYKQIFSEKKWHSEEHPTLNAAGFFDEYLGYQFFVVAYFFDGADKLAKIGMHLGLGTDLIESDKQLKDVYKKLIENLTKIYGKPQFSESIDKEEQKTTSAEYRGSDMKTWKTKDTIVSSTLILFESGSPDPGVGIIWGDIKNDPASSWWAKSELSDGEKPEKLPKDFQLSDEKIEEIKKSMKNSSN